MKIPPRTKLEPTDAITFQPGSFGKASRAASATKPFKLDPIDLTPKKPGVSDDATSSLGALRPADLAPMKPGNPGKASLRPLNQGEIPHPSPSVKQVSASARSQHDQLTEQARKWVAQTFFGTLLKQMSDSPFKSELFSGGRG